MAGVGWLVRDGEGRCVDGQGGCVDGRLPKLDSVVSALMAETTGIKEALSWLKTRYQNVPLMTKSDSYWSFKRQTQATHSSGNVLSFYTIPEYYAWRDSLMGNASSWTIKYYKAPGTNNQKEGKEYFKDIEKRKKVFILMDDQDGNAIKLAFSKKKIDERKNWLRQYQPGTHLDQKPKLTKYSEFINKELILFSVADFQRSIPSMIDGLKPIQRKILFSWFKRNLVKDIKVSQFQDYVSEKSAYHHGDQSQDF
ncbi:hypothetical protein JCGZ_16794 [Jatropha curcas]|uniref:DNA topoisomerase (ATP-hydrolyzing) n=1 Tax=Jatropha curcas TaxID=180498 RepID=A0A067L503_JATCU|nr:hypothetical protein JCGZ_16794 [Jatropha curcas]